MSFRFDVFLSHSAKDRIIVRPLADRLRADGLNVWFDEGEIQRDESVASGIEEALEKSRVLASGAPAFVAVRTYDR